MFFTKPKLPVEPKMREWVDASMGRFTELFGAESLTTAKIVTPTDDCFPDDWNGTPECAELLFARICGYMGVPRFDVDLKVFVDEDRESIDALRKSSPLLNVDNPGAAGLYHYPGGNGNPIVAIDRKQLPNINSVIATMAHELGHVLLLAGGHIERDAADMEPLTDLITVFRGLGIFTANSATNFSQHCDGIYQGWSVKTLGYLSEPTYGYALAVYANRRSERNPKWLQYLKLNVRTYFKQSAAALAKERQR